MRHNLPAPHTVPHLATQRAGKPEGQGRSPLLLMALALYFLIMPRQSVAQYYHFQPFTVQDGLPSPMVYDLAQDSLGRIWFATRNGIACYDGLSWQYVSADRGLLNQNIKQLKIDSTGKIWAVPERLDQGIFYFNGKAWLHRPAPGIPETEAYSLVVAAQLTTLPGSTPWLWVGTDGSGLFCYRPDGWHRYGSKGPITFSSVFGLATRGHFLYLATERGTFALNLASDELRFLKGAPLEATHGIFLEPADRSGGQRIWLAGRNWVGMLQNGRFVRSARKVPFGLLSPFVQVVLHATRTGEVFAGNPFGLYLIKPDGQVKPFGVQNGLVATGITRIFEDREGNLWFASLRGVSKLSSRRFVNYRRLNGLFADEVTAITADQNGQVFLGHHGGLSVFKHGHLSTLRLPLPAHWPPFADRVMDLLVDNRQRLWVVTNGLGVWLRRPGGTFHRVPVANNPRLSCILQDHRGRIWLGTYQGLYKLDGGHYVPVHSPPQLKTYIRTLAEADSDLLLMATPEALIQYRVSTGQVRLYTGSRWGGSNVYCALRLPEGQTLVGTRSGLYSIHGDSLGACPLPKLSLNCPVYFLRRDSQGRLWLGTDRGVYQWNQGQLRHFTNTDGLAGMETNREAVYIDEKGRVWIGTDQGLSIYQPSLDRGPRRPPLVRLGTLQTPHRTLSLTGRHLKLASNENELFIHFSIVSFWEEKTLQVRFRLAGYDSSWFYDRTGLTRHIRYTNLPPGRYRFEVQAAAEADQWSPVTRSAWFSIAKPYWQRAWFMALLVLLLLAAGASVQSVGNQIRYRKKLEVEVAQRTAQLQRSEARYRRLFESTGEVVFACDADGCLVEINPAARNVLACKHPKQLLGKHLGQLFFVNPEQFQTFVQSIQRDGSVRDWAVDIRDLKGEGRSLRISATALFGPNGSFQGFSGLMRDETEIRRLEQQFFEAQKMESIALLAGGVAHDFNNILGGILGYASFTKMKLPADSPLQAYLDTLETAARRGAELTAQLLAFSRKKQGRFQPIQLNRVVSEAHRLLRSSIDRAITIQLDLEESLPPIEADETQIHQVIMNLCLNACDAITEPEQGMISIITRQAEISTAEKRQHIDARPGRYVILEVVDNGIGMDEETRRRIFEPFFTTKRKGKGTGLGLAMVYGVVKHCQGFLVVDSHPGRGSRFTIYFPASQKQECRAVEQTNESVGGNESILVVDDEDPLRELFRAVLEEHGYRVQVARDGLEALALLSTPNNHFDLIVLDMRMPRMSGRALLERLSRSNGRLRVLVSSGFSTQLGGLRNLVHGPIDFIGKPFRVNELLHVVRKLLNTPLPA